MWSIRGGGLGGFDPQDDQIGKVIPPPGKLSVRGAVTEDN